MRPRCLWERTHPRGRKNPQSSLFQEGRQAPEESGNSVVSSMLLLTLSQAQLSGATPEF